MAQRAQDIHIDFNHFIGKNTFWINRHYGRVILKIIKNSIGCYYEWIYRKKYIEFILMNSNFELREPSDVQ